MEQKSISYSIIKSVYIVHVTWKAKTDTDAFPFNGQKNGFKTEAKRM